MQFTYYCTYLKIPVLLDVGDPGQDVGVLF